MNYAGAQGVNVASNLKQERSSTEEINERIRSCDTKIRDLTSILAGHANSIFGSRPESTEVSVGGVGQSCVTSSVSSLESSISDLESIAARFS